MAGPSPRHRPRPRPAGASPRRGSAGPVRARAGGGRGRVRPAPRRLARPLAAPAGAAREPARLGFDERRRLLRRRPRCRALSGFWRSRRRPAPGPALGAPAAPPTPGGEWAGLRGLAPPPRAPGEQRRGPPPSPCAVRPPVQCPLRGAFRPRSRPPGRAIGPLRGCAGGAGRARGELRRWYGPSAGFPTPARGRLPAVQVSAPGGRGLGQSQGYRALLKCRYGCGEGDGGKGRAGLPLKATRENSSRAPSPARVPRPPPSPQINKYPRSGRRRPFSLPGAPEFRAVGDTANNRTVTWGSLFPAAGRLFVPFPAPRLLRPRPHPGPLPEHAAGLRLHS
nr:translation initiation factor IF-2-like [Pan troglodytes]